MPYLTHPKHTRRTNKDDQPVFKAQAALGYIEELLQSRYLCHGYLSKQNDGRNNHQSLASLEVQCAAIGLKCPCTEQVKEVCHHEDCEEQRQLIGRESICLPNLNVQEVCKTRYV